MDQKSETGKKPKRDRPDSDRYKTHEKLYLQLDRSAKCRTQLEKEII